MQHHLLPSGVLRDGEIVLEHVEAVGFDVYVVGDERAIETETYGIFFKDHTPGSRLTCFTTIKGQVNEALAVILSMEYEELYELVKDGLSRIWADKPDGFCKVRPGANVTFFPRVKA